MDEYSYLRMQAARKRDAAISAAKADYKKASDRIRALRKQLGGESRKASKAKLQPVRELLPAVLPRDRLFTVEEAYDLLRQTDPMRYFHLPSKPLGEMRISMKQATMALGMILEGLSIRATERLTGLHRDTIDQLILTVGENCQRLLETKVRGVEVKDVQLDEIWSFIAMKEKTRAARGYSLSLGDSWTFIAIERETKLVLAHQVGQRDTKTCWAFMLRLKNAVGKGRFQLTTDGLNAYRTNVPFAFGMQVDFAQLIKTYASTQETTRYSPAKIQSTEKLPTFGNPDDDKICTSHIERLNLTMRMNNRRFTRLTNAHSKSPKHHAAMQAIFFAFYNFCRKHETLKGKTPAMASGLTTEVWSVKRLLEEAAAV